MAKSRRQISRLVNLAYRVAAASDPTCKIERDRLCRRYRDVNYGINVSCETPEKLAALKKVFLEAFERRGLGCEITDYTDGSIYVWPYRMK